MSKALMRPFRPGRFAGPKGPVQWVTALGATVVALGAVLTAPGTANAAVSITLSSTCGAAETTVTVTGSGLQPGQKSVWVTAARPNGDYVNQKPAPIDGAGNFSVPIGFDVSANGADPAAPAVKIGIWSNGELASAWYFVGCAGVYTAPRLQMRQSGPMSLRVVFYDFAPDTPVQLTIAGLPAPAPVLPDLKNGNTFTFDSQPPCGVAAITARQQTIDRKDPEPPIGFAPSRPAVRAALAPIAAPDRVANSSIYVFCPQVGAQPSSYADTALPGSTTVRGTDWYPSSPRRPIPVQLFLDGTKLGEVEPSQKDRSFSTQVTLPRSRCGVHQLTAVQTYDDRETVQFTLSAATSITVRCAQALLTVTPTVTEAGRIIQAVGAKFIGGRTVKLEWVDLENKPLEDAGTATAAADGTFTLETLVMPNTDLGTRRLHALDLPAAGDPRGAREGFAELLLVPGSMERGRSHFLERR